MNTKHYICKVEDSINKYKVIVSIYCDYSTPLQAKKFFLKHELIKKYIGNKRYQITMRQNPDVLQSAE